MASGWSDRNAHGTLRIGDKAPDFAGITDSGEKVSLIPKRSQGKKVVLCFCPKDHTPGCTKEDGGIQHIFTRV